MSKRTVLRAGRTERGQVLILVLLVLMFVGVSMIAGTGDIAMAQHEHERADEAATLGALSAAPGAASIYAGAPSLDRATAVTDCMRAVHVVAPEARTDPPPCVIDASDPRRQRLLVSVVIDFRLPIPVPFIASTVRANRIGELVAGTVTAP